MDMYTYNEIREKNLSSFAAKSTDFLDDADSTLQTKNIIKSPFELDKEFILQSEAFKKLAGKSQNLIVGSLYNATSRLIHTFDVVSVASKISKGLGLNSDLTEAIAYGHDVGHMPFSHNAQIASNNLMKKMLHGNASPAFHKSLEDFFYVSGDDEVVYSHQKQSFYILNMVETPPNRKLSVYTQVGLLHNFRSKADLKIFNELSEKAVTFEMLVVELADYITWINHDLVRAVECGLISLDAINRIPLKNGYVLGDLLKGDRKARVERFIADAVEFNLTQQRLEKNGACIGQTIKLSPLFMEALEILGELVYENILNTDFVLSRANQVQEAVVEYLTWRIEEIKRARTNGYNDDRIDMVRICRSVCDEVWSLSDFKFMQQYEQINYKQSQTLKKSLLGDC